MQFLFHPSVKACSGDWYCPANMLELSVLDSSLQMDEHYNEMPMGILEHSCHVIGVLSE